MTKTIIIWDDMESNIRFKVVDGDKRHLNEKYINLVGTPPAIEDEINDLLIDAETQRTIPMLDSFPLDEFGQGNEVYVIVCGFMP